MATCFYWVVLGFDELPTQWAKEVSKRHIYIYIYGAGPGACQKTRKRHIYIYIYIYIRRRYRRMLPENWSCHPRILIGIRVGAGTGACSPKLDFTLVFKRNVLFCEGFTIFFLSVFIGFLAAQAAGAGTSTGLILDKGFCTWPYIYIYICMYRSTAIYICMYIHVCMYVYTRAGLSL